MSMTKHTPPKDFESAVAELEATVATMEGGKLPLDQSMAAYQRGTELVRFCRQALNEVEQQIRILDEANTLQPYSDQDE